jgi:ribonuclease J
VLAAFSPQNIDRFVTVFRAARRSGRAFIVDLYLARILDELAMPSLPRASQDGLRVYLPSAQKRRIVIERDFEVLSPYRSSRIYPEEIIGHPAGWVMLFRESMTSDIERLGPRTASTLIYSMWPGDLRRETSTLAAWCQRHGIAVELAHTSGHADAATLLRLAKAINATAVVPIHTEAPLSMSS